MTSHSQTIAVVGLGRMGANRARCLHDSGSTLAADLELDLPLSKATQQQYQRMIDSGLGELDKSGIAELTFQGRNNS